MNNFIVFLFFLSRSLARSLSLSLSFAFAFARIASQKQLCVHQHRLFFGTERERERGRENEWVESVKGSEKLSAMHTYLLSVSRHVKLRRLLRLCAQKFSFFSCVFLAHSPLSQKCNFSLRPVSMLNKCRAVALPSS